MAVNSLTLESYIQLHQALTKHGQVVQSVTPIEECYYKIADLRQLLQLHGFAAGKFNRAELLAAVKGQKLINPFSSSSSTACSSAASKLPEPTSGQQQHPSDDPKLPFTAAEVCSVLGMQGANPQGLRFLALGPAASFNAAAAAGPPSEPSDQDTPPEDTPSPPSGDDAVDAAADQPPPAAPTASHQDHHSKARSQQQQQQAGPSQQPQQATQTQQATATANAQPLQDPTTQNQQQQHHQPQHAQVLQTQHTEAVAASSAAALQSSSLALADPLLQQLLARLLTQHAAASAPTIQILTQQQQQHPAQELLQPSQHTLQPAPTSASTGDLITRLLARGTGPAHSTGLPQPANPAGSTASIPTAPPPAGAAAAPCDPPPAQQQPQAEEAPSQAVPAHTPWLRPQLQWLADNGLCLANPAAAAVRCRGDGGLLGCRVGFVLLEAMQVAGARNTLLTLPAGFYEGMAVKYLGSSCQREVCEADCPGQHQYYRACVLPPRALPEPQPGSSNGSSGGGSSGGSSAADLAASLAQAHVASSGRAVLLILDLHRRLRSHSLEGLLQIETPEQLQDAWVLLKHEEERPGSCSPPQPQPEEAMPAVRLPQKRGRKPGGGGPGHHKRAK